MLPGGHDSIKTQSLKIIQNKIYQQQKDLIQLRSTFEYFDTQGTGKVSLENFRQILKHGNINLSLNEINQLVFIYDPQK